ncbi:MAG: hypothetical protein WEC75_10105 [Dehalococcoidia bacterium]
MTRATVILAAMILALGAIGNARAQEAPAVETRTAGPYEIAVRYEEKPRLEVEDRLLITVRETATGAPVEGLEDTLILRGRVLVRGAVRGVATALLPSRTEPGLYHGLFIPPALGDYEWRITGTIVAEDVDVTFAAGGEALPGVGVAENDFTSPGAIIAWVILAAYVAAITGLLIRMVWRRGRGRQSSAVTLP